MSENKRNFLVHGGILAMAGILVRIIGMFYRIPLVNIIGSDGNGIYGAAYNVYNIMLVGLDTTDKGWIGNSDSMILISINYRLEQISMISLMRDTHVMIPGIGYRGSGQRVPFPL